MEVIFVAPYGRGSRITNQVVGMSDPCQSKLNQRGYSNIGRQVDFQIFVFSLGLLE